MECIIERPLSRIYRKISLVIFTVSRVSVLQLLLTLIGSSNLVKMSNLNDGKYIYIW